MSKRAITVAIKTIRKHLLPVPVQKVLMGRVPVPVQKVLMGRVLAIDSNPEALVLGFLSILRGMNRLGDESEYLLNSLRLHNSPEKDHHLARLVKVIAAVINAEARVVRNIRLIVEQCSVPQAAKSGQPPRNC